jgi:hypothetical protein
MKLLYRCSIDDDHDDFYVDDHDDIHIYIYIYAYIYNGKKKQSCVTSCK